MRIRCCSESNRNSASALHSSVLPTPVGPEEQERAVGPVRIGETRARAADRVGDEAHRLVLADHALVQRVLHLQELLALALHHLRHRDAGRARDDLGDLLDADLRAQQLRLAGLRVALLLVGLLQLRLELRQLAVLQLAHLLPVAAALGLLHLRA